MARSLLDDCIEQVRSVKDMERWGLATLESVAERILEHKTDTIRLREQTIIDLIASLVATGTWKVEDGVDECRRWFGA